MNAFITESLHKHHAAVKNCPVGVCISRKHLCADSIVVITIPKVLECAIRTSFCAGSELTFDKALS
ncbi:MAG: hypothetical protein ACLSGW_07060 [Clostridium sp.]